MTELLRKIRMEAGQAGDLDQVEDCNRALRGDRDALARVIEAATSSEYSRYVVVDGELKETNR